MQNVLAKPVRGTIKVTNLLGNCGIVTLDEPYEGLKWAVINTETVGRITLMSSTPDGGLPVDRPVVITQAHKGSEALLALEVQSGR
jgi:hypothetical protein